MIICRVFGFSGNKLIKNNVTYKSKRETKTEGDIKILQFKHIK